MPPTIAAGQTGLMPRMPSTMPTRISGTNSASSGVWRPTIAPRSSFGSSVRPASVTIGIAIAPNATGAVLATSATAAAFIGLKPRPTSIVAVIATGVPKPASASSSAPNENAMITAWIRWSSEIARERAPEHREVPGASVMLKIQIAFKTIHMIGNRPKAAPSRPASIAWPNGIE